MTPEQWEADYENAFGKDWRRRVEADMDATYTVDEQLGHYDWELDESLGGYAFPDEVEDAEDGDYFPCGCEFCYCSNLTLLGCKCGDCLSGAHQG